MPHPDDLQEEPPGEDPVEDAEIAPVVPEAVPRLDVYEQIRRLAQLRDEGLITSEEFEEKKRDLLDRL